jgi:hypothetical protein
LQVCRGDRSKCISRWEEHQDQAREPFENRLPCIFAYRVALEPAPTIVRFAYGGGTRRRDYPGALMFVPKVGHAYRLVVEGVWGKRSCRIEDEESGEIVVQADPCRDSIAPRYERKPVEAYSPLSPEEEAAIQERLFREAEAVGTIEAYERFLEQDTWGGMLEVEAERRIEKLRTKDTPGPHHSPNGHGVRRR